MSNKIAPNIVDVEAALATLGEMPELQYVPNSDKVRDARARGRADALERGVPPRHTRPSARAARPRGALARARVTQALGRAPSALSARAPPALARGARGARARRSRSR